jgi:hypothetical protein
VFLKRFIIETRIWADELYSLEKTAYYLLFKSSVGESFSGSEESNEKKKKNIRLDLNSFDCSLLCDSGLQHSFDRGNHLVAEMSHFFCLSSDREIAPYSTATF